MPCPIHPPLRSVRRSVGTKTLTGRSWLEMPRPWRVEACLRVVQEAWIEPKDQKMEVGE